MPTVLLRLQRGISILFILMLAGCFRPAGDSVQPTVQSSVPSADTNATTIPLDSTSELPPITLISPASSTPNVAGTPEPIMTMITLAPATATEVPPTVPSVPTLTLQIITPGMSLGLFTPDATLLPTSTPNVTRNPETTDEAGAPILTSEIETLDPVSADGCLYTVEAGDSLYSIAVSQGTTVNDLLLANPDLEGDPPILQIEQVLQLPACIPGLNADATEEVDSEPDQMVEVPEGGQIYVVQAGDVLGAIASRYGVTIRAIMDANGLTNPDALSIGQELIIPAPQN